MVRTVFGISRPRIKLLHRLCRPLGEIMPSGEPSEHLQSQTGLGDSSDRIAPDAPKHPFFGGEPPKNAKRTLFVRSTPSPRHLWKQASVIAPPPAPAKPQPARAGCSGRMAGAPGHSGAQSAADQLPR